MMRSWLSGAAKAVAAGIVAGGGALLIYLNVDPDLVAILGLILGPLAVFVVPNAGASGG